MNQEKRKPIEKNPLKRAWIYIWYWDVTRLIVASGIHLIPSFYLMKYLLSLGLNLEGTTIRNLFVIQYLLFLIWAMSDNDYTQLERIGLNTSRKPLDTKNK